MYNIRVTLYSNGPLLTELVTAPKIDIVRTPINEVSALIEQDLIFRIEVFLNTGATSNERRINKMLANQFFAEVYLRIGKRDDVEIQAFALINIVRYTLINLRYGVNVIGSGGHFSDICVKENQRKNQGNTEGI